MRISALVLLGTVFVLVGQYVNLRLNRRVRTLEQLQLMLGTVENEIRYLLRPADEIVRCLASSRELGELKFLRECKRLMDSGEDFKSAWCDSIADTKNCSFLKREDTALLISFAEGFGVSDVDGQVANCRIHSELVRDKLNLARSERERYSALASGLGIATGVGVFIILI